jgi:hypothetical protein
MANPTDEDKRTASLHATVWERTFNIASENAGRRTDIDQTAMKTLAVFALMIGGEYRKIANGSKIDE